MAEVKLTILGEDKSSPVITSWENRIKSAVGSVKMALTALGVTAAGLSIAKVFSDGTKAVDDFQQSVIKTAAMITSLQGGDNVAENYRLAKEYAVGLQDVLAEVDAKTSLNVTNLTQITEEMVKQGVVLDINNKKQIEAFTSLANAVAVYSQNGAQEVQVRQEVRALMMGEVDANSQLASMIQKTVDGPLKEKVKQWKKSGVLVEEIGKRLVGFNAASGDISNTWSAITSTFQTIVTRLLRGGFSEIVKDLVTYGQQFGDYLKEHEELIGNRIKQGWMAVKGAVEGVYRLFVTSKGELTAVAQVTGMIVKGWGLLLTAVFPPLMERVGAFSRAIWENVKMFGNLASMVWTALKGDFGGAMAYFDAAKSNWMEGGKAVGKAFSSGFGDEVAKRAEQFLALDNVVKSVSGKIATPKVNPAPDLAELTKQFKERAKTIIDIEKTRIQTLERLESEHLQKLKKNYEEQVQELDKFNAAMAEVTQSWRDREKARIDAARGPEEPLVKRARILEELSAQEQSLNESWADPAEKVKSLNNLIPKYRELFGEITDGKDVIISQIEADRDFTIAEERIKTAIMAVAEEMKLKEAATVSAAEAVDRSEARIKSYKDQLIQLDQMLRNMANEKVINVDLKINGIQDLYKVSAIMKGAGVNTGIKNYGDYYTQGGKTYWADGTLADEGTSVAEGFAVGTQYVPRTGLYQLHRGETVNTRQDSSQPAGNMITIEGGIQIVVQGGNTANETLDQVARQLAPHLERYMRRKAA